MSASFGVSPVKAARSSRKFHRPREKISKSSRIKRGLRLPLGNGFARKFTSEPGVDLFTHVVPSLGEIKAAGEHVIALHDGDDASGEMFVRGQWIAPELVEIGDRCLAFG